MKTQAVILRMIAVLAACPAGRLCASEPRQFDVLSAVDLAMRQNREVRSLAIAVNSRSLDLADARAQYRFTVTPEGTAGVYDGHTDTGFGASLARETTWGTRAQAGAVLTHQDWAEGPSFHRGALRLGVDQPLLRRFGPLVHREPIILAEHGAATAQRELELRRTDLVVRVVEAHEHLLRLQQQFAFDTQTVSRLSQVVRLTQARQRQGRSSAVDTLRAELKLGTAQSQLNTTRERINAMQADYADLLGLPPDTPILALAGPTVSVEIPPGSQAAETALKNRLDYAQVLQDYEDVLRGIKIARHNLLPDVSLVSRYELAGTGDSAGEAVRLDTSVWFVGLSASSDLPMRSGRIAVERSLLDREGAEIRIAAVRSAILRQVEQAQAECRRAEAELPLAERNYALALNRARLSRRLFDMGKGDSFSVSDAEDELRSAERNRLASESDAVVATYRLLRVLGTVIEYPDDLKPGAVNP
jgi:outer membrane protein TolC